MKYKTVAYDSRQELEFTYNEWFENFVNSLYEKNGNNKIWLSEKMNDIVNKYVQTDAVNYTWYNKANTIKLNKYKEGKYNCIYIKSIVKEESKIIQELRAELEYLKDELNLDIEEGKLDFIKESKEEIKRVEKLLLNY